MKKQNFFSLATIGALLISLTLHAAPPNLGWRKGVVLVKLNDHATSAQTQALNAIYSKYGMKVEKRLLKGKVVRLKISNPSFTNQEPAIAAQIKNTGAVDISELDYYVPLASLPNDTLYSQQWHHTVINSPAAWDISVGNPNVLVAICDAGFELSHPDLISRFVLPGYNTVKDNTEISYHSHGTMTSGTLAALGNNSLGVAGMAWQTGILPIQVSDQEDGVSTYSDLAECITYAQGSGAKVVNISYDYTYTSAIIDEAALNFRNAGGLVVAAAGNSGSDISVWGRSDVLFLAGSSSPADVQSWFTNYGDPIDLYAPGEDILTTIAANDYIAASGTSFSSPIIAGTAALIYSLNSQWTPSQVENFLVSTATQVSGINRLNAGAALQAAKNALAPPPPIVLDNLRQNLSDSSRISKGRWCTLGRPGYFGNRSLVSCGKDLDSYRFVPTISTARAYRIYVRYLTTNKTTTRATIKIKYAAGTLTKRINMTANEGTWVSLGTFNLAAGRSNYLEVNDSTGEVNVDGARFVPAP